MELNTKKNELLKRLIMQKNCAAGWEGARQKKTIFISLNSDINYEKFTVKDKNLLKSVYNKLNH